MLSKGIAGIYFANDDNAPYLYVSLHSLVRHTDDMYNYQIYILYAKIEQRHVKRLEGLSKENIRITCIDIKNKSNMEKGERSWFYEMLSRYFGVLCIDAETLILSDIAKFFANNLNGKTEGAVQPCTEEQLKKYCQILEGVKGLADQDALDRILKNQIYFLDAESGNFQNIKVIHYGKEKRPWEHPEYAMSNLFWEEARKTPYYEEILFKNIKGERKINTDLFRNHIFPFDKVPRDSRIALYGAGAVGRVLNEQNSIVNYVDIVLWVDKNYKNIEVPGTLDGPERLLEDQESYDYVLIAIDDPVICSAVERTLVEKGLPKEKILWTKYGRNR